MKGRGKGGGRGKEQIARQGHLLLMPSIFGHLQLVGFFFFLFFSFSFLFGFGPAFTLARGWVHPSSLAPSDSLTEILVRGSIYVTSSYREVINIIIR